MPKIKERIILDDYRFNPEAFIRDHIGVGICDCGCQIDPQQSEVIDAYRALIICKTKLARINNRLAEKDQFEKKGKQYDKVIEKMTPEEQEIAEKLGINIRSPKGTGKETVTAWICIHWVFFFGADMKNMATAPTFAQLIDNWFAEVNKWVVHSWRVKGGMEKNDTSQAMLYRFFGFQTGLIYQKEGISKDDLKKNGITVARTMRKNGNDDDAKDTLSGYHSYWQIIFCDEVYSIPDGVLRALRTTLTRPINFAIMFGNPTTSTGYANDAWGENSKFWINIQMDLERSTVVSDIYKKGVYDEYKNYPNLLRVYYYGLPPLEEERAIMSFDKICNCTQLENEDISWENEPTILTADIGMGGDETSILIMQGMKTIKLVEKKCGAIGSKTATEVNEDFIEEHIAMYEPDFIGVDPIGVGRGVCDNLKKKYPSKVFGVDFSEEAEPRDKNKYRNKRAELYFALADKVNSLAMQLANNQRLKGELNVIKTVADVRLIQIVSKKDIRKELGRSTNLSDVYAMRMFFNDKRYMEIKKERDTRDKYERELQEANERSWMSA